MNPHGLLYTANLKLDDVDENIEDRLNKKKDFDKLIEQVRIRIHKKEEELKGYSKQLAQGYINEKLFLGLSGDANNELGKLETQLADMEDMAEYQEDEKENIIRSIDILKEIIQKKALTNANISMLIDKIILKETDEIGEYKKPKLDIEIVWNAPFINICEVSEGLEIAV